MPYQIDLQIQKSEGCNINISKDQAHIHVSTWRRAVDIKKKVETETGKKKKKKKGFCS